MAQNSNGAQAEQIFACYCEECENGKGMVKSRFWLSLGSPDWDVRYLLAGFAGARYPEIPVEVAASLGCSPPPERI